VTVIPMPKLIMMGSNILSEPEFTELKNKQDFFNVAF